ncbi:hypothetical protein GGX14DRAFT_381014 [Mycena pura]|uniref:SH3 domain-containing protein n=1 Tax=Mycena pura TaxID=153505 RepID=A0AAD6UNS4_9AGAR|nr:hypothetical protein GGX14DRAFT_381014 [Mycena pura]
MSSVNKDPTSSDVPPAPSSDHGPSHDFCNNLWGVGNVGVDVLFARVRRGLRSMKQLQSFWRERASIEEEYGSRLLDLVKPMLGKEKTGKKLTALEALVQVTETQGTAHQRLASRIRAELEEPTTSFVQQRLRAEIQKARETVQANEQNLSQATNSIRDVTMRWQKDKLWAYAKMVSKMCAEDDESCERVRVALDDFEVPDEIEAFVDEYGTGNSMPEPLTYVPLSNGSPHIPQQATRPAQFVRVSTRPQPGASNKQRSTGRYTKAGLNSAATISANGRAPTTLVPPPPPPPNGPSDERPILMGSTSSRAILSLLKVHELGSPQPALRKLAQISCHTTDSSSSAPLPRAPTPVPPLLVRPVDEKRILFIVEALYDYTATIDGEFDFQAGDIIGVTATPDNGWWSGELLDDERRKDGKHIFPSNFVTLRGPQVTQTRIITSKVDPDVMSFKWNTLTHLRQQV